MGSTTVRVEGREVDVIWVVEWRMLWGIRKGTSWWVAESALSVDEWEWEGDVVKEEQVGVMEQK